MVVAGSQPVLSKPKGFNQVEVVVHSVLSGNGHKSLRPSSSRGAAPLSPVLATFLVLAPSMVAMVEMRNNVAAVCPL